MDSFYAKELVDRLGVAFDLVDNRGQAEKLKML